MYKVFEVHLRSGQCFVLVGVVSVIFHKDHIFFVTDDFNGECYSYPVDDVILFSCVLDRSEV